jgi:hypothetical protein
MNASTGRDGDNLTKNNDLNFFMQDLINGNEAVEAGQRTLRLSTQDKKAKTSELKHRFHKSQNPHRRDQIFVHNSLEPAHGIETLRNSMVKQIMSTRNHDTKHGTTDHSTNQKFSN